MREHEGLKAKRLALTPDHYARMADAATELAYRSAGLRRKQNEALSGYYRALSVRPLAGARRRERNNKWTHTV